MDRSWRTWSDVAQRAIIAYVLVDIAFYVGAALPGGTTFGSAAAGGLWVFVDLCLIWGMWGGSRFSLGTSFALALFGPVTFALTVLPIAAFNGITTPNAGYGLVFALTEVILLGIAMGCADRDESQDSGMPSGAINRPHSTP